MGIMSGIAVYVMIWTIVLFMVLPWKIKIPEEIEKGHATSAPENPYILRKFLITSLISAVLWGLSDLVISSDWATFRE